MIWEESAEGSQIECFKELWKIQIPAKVAVFAWRLLRDILPTRKNLQRQQVQSHNLSCPFCSSHEEDAAHLFIHCSRIQPIWWESMSWLNIQGAFPQTPQQHFIQHSCVLSEGIRIKRWQLWWLALTWTIWQLRNKILFSNESFNGNKPFEDAIFLLWTWIPTK